MGAGRRLGDAGHWRSKDAIMNHNRWSHDLVDVFKDNGENDDTIGNQE